MKYKIIFLLILSFTIQSIKANDYKSNQKEYIPQIYDSSMKIYNKDKIIEKIYLNLTNSSKLFLSDVQFSYTGKLIYLKEYKNIKKLKDKTVNYRIKWIFMFDSIKELTIFVELLKKRKLEYYTNIIIIPKNISEIPFKYYDYLINIRIFIFYTENHIFQNLVNKYDYTNNNTNIYARLLSSNNKEYNLNHLNFIIYISTLILILCINLYKYKIGLDLRNLTFFFVRTIYFFLFIKSSITILYMIKLKFLSIYNDLFNIGTTNMITFLISSLDIFFKSIFISFSILASKGIDETLRMANRAEFIIFMRKFIFIYFILSSTLVNNNYLKSFPKFLMIYSFIIESFIIYLIYRNKRFAQIDLIKKLNLATLYCREYIITLKLKLSMLLWHFRIYLLYYMIIIFLNMYFNLVNLVEVEKEIFIHFIDIIIIVCYCLIYRPRKWPENFDVFFKSDFNYFDNIYCYELNSDISNNITYEEEKKNKILNDGYNSDESDKLNESETIKLRNKKDKFNVNKIKNYYAKNKDFPIIILNPQYFFKSNKNEEISSNNKDIYSNSFKNSSIGFFDKKDNKTH